MSVGEFLNHWWNFPYLVMLGLTVVYFLLQILGLIGHAAHHDHGADHDADHDAQHGSWDEVLSFFGIGRVPFMVVWLTLFIFAGLTGLFLNWLYARDHASYPWWFFLISLASALVVGLIAVRLFSRLAARLHFANIDELKGAVSRALKPSTAAPPPARKGLASGSGGAADHADGA